MDRDGMIELTKGVPVLSEKIRILDRAGVAKADIARFVDRRYQHVYNVLLRVDRDRSRIAGATRGGQDAGGGDVPDKREQEVMRLVLGKDGDVRLPAVWVETQGLKAGDTIFCRTSADGLEVMSRSAAVAALSEIARRQMPEQAGLLDAILGAAGNKIPG